MPRDRRVVLRPDLRAADVLQLNERAVFAALEDDAFELAGVLQPTRGAHADLVGLAGGRGLLADLSGRDLQILLLQRADDVARGQLPRREPRGVEPHARACGSTPRGSPRGSSPRRTWSARCRSRTCRSPPARSASRPRPPGQPYQISVRASGRLVEAEEFERIVLQRGPTARSCGSKDVGRAELGAENYATILRFNGRAAVGIGIFQLPTANALDVRDARDAEIDALVEAFPPGLECRGRHRHHAAVRESIDEVLRRSAEAIVLVILVIFVFLHGCAACSSRPSRCRSRSSARSRS